jgi:hypothetical protein
VWIASETAAAAEDYRFDDFSVSEAWPRRLIPMILLWHCCQRDSVDRAVVQIMELKDAHFPLEKCLLANRRPRHSRRFVANLAHGNCSSRIRTGKFPFCEQNAQCTRDGVSRQQDLNGELLGENCEPTALISPWHSNLYHSMPRTIDLRDTGVQQGLELAAVKVPPLPLGSVVMARQCL